MSVYASLDTALGTPRVMDAFRTEGGSWVVPVRFGDALSIRLRSPEDAEAYARAFAEAARRLREREAKK